MLERTNQPKRTAKLKAVPKLDEQLQADKPEKVLITPTNWREVAINIKSRSPFVYNKFSAHDIGIMRRKQEAGQQASNRRVRKPKDFDALWKGTVHISTEGWYGIPAEGLRTAMIDSCPLTGVKMTMAKKTIFVLADGYDRDDGSALVKLTKGVPRRFDRDVRIGQNTTDIKTAGRLDEWAAIVRIRWDVDQFSATDIVNLLSRAGQQNGIGAGRANSKTSTGMGWGFFEVMP